MTQMNDHVQEPFQIIQNESLDRFRRNVHVFDCELNKVVELYVEYK